MLLRHFATWLPFMAVIARAEVPVFHITYQPGEDKGPMNRLVSKIDSLPTSDAKGVHTAARFFPNSESQLRATLASPVPPDLATVVFGADLAAETYPHLTPLNSVFSSSGLDAEGQIPPAIARASRHALGGPGTRTSPVVLPFSASVSVFFYRRSVFARHGLAVPETWEELMALLRRLRDIGGGKAPMSATHASQAGLAIWWLDMLFARKYGAEAHRQLLDGEINLVEDPRVKEALLQAAEPFLEGLIASTGSLFPDLIAFGQGLQSMVWGPGFYATVLATAAPQLAGDIGTFPFPTVTAGTPRAELLPFRAFVVPAAAPLNAFGLRVLNEVVAVETGFDIYFEGSKEPDVVPIISSHAARIPEKFTVTRALVDFITGADEVIVSLLDAKPAYRDALLALLLSAQVPPGTNATAFQAMFFPSAAGGSGGGPPPGVDTSGGGGPPPGVDTSGGGGPPPGVVTRRAQTGATMAKVESSRTAHIVPPGLPEALARALRDVATTTATGTAAETKTVVRSRSGANKSKANQRDAAAATTTTTTITTTTRAAVAAGAAPGAVGTDAVIAAVDSALAMAEATRVAEFLGKVPDPVATPAAGAYEVPLEVKVTTGLDDDDKVKIFFTLDGSVPTELSPEYSGGLTLSQPGDTTLRLLATREGLASSQRVTVVYALSGGDADGMTIEEILTLVVAPAVGALLIISIAVVLLVRRRLAAARDSQWEINPEDVTINRDKVLGIGSSGIVYEGTFRGTAVAVKELFMTRKAWADARSKALGSGTIASVGIFNPTSPTMPTLPSSKGKDKDAPKGGARVAPSTRLRYGAAEQQQPPSDDIDSTATSTHLLNSTLINSRVPTGWAASSEAINSATSAGQTVNTGESVARVRSVFAAEVATISSLRHPNCLFLYGAYLTKNTAAMVVERMAHSVYDLLHTRLARASAKRRLEMAGDAASGLVYLHANNPPIMHRDVKSLNLLVSDRGEVKVSDFGLSEVQGRNGRSIGSAPWTAPEVWADPASYSLASDVYSFGVTLYEFATSRDPWAGVSGVKTTSDISKRVAIGDRPPLTRDDLASDIIPDGLIDLINDCWAHEPSQRPTMAQVHARLAELTATVPDEDEGGADVGLLSLMVPAAQAREMMAMSRRGEPVPPIELESTTILFADIVGFTEISSRLSPTKVTALLTRCFDIFEAIIAEQRLVKVDTIGDCIIIGGGLRSEERESGADAGDHAPRVLKAALEMIDRTKGVTIDPEDPDATAVRWRIGVATGPITATVVGREVLKTQLVGDACNTASRMESTGVAGRVQVTDGVRSACTHDASLSFKKRGTMEVKGKGEMLTWWVEAK